jgi:lysozyme
MTTARLYDELTRDEGKRNKAYKDSKGIWSIGIGHNILADPVLRPQLSRLQTVGLSDAEVKALFATDVAKAEKQLDANIPWWRKLSDVRQDAIANLAFNLGIGKFLTWAHTLAAIQQSINDGNFKRVGDMLRNTQPWADQVGDRATRIADQFATDIPQIS